MFTIEPLIVAYGPQREKSRFTYMHNAGVRVDIPYVSWLIRSPDYVALFDVGCTAGDYITHIRPKDAPLVHVGQKFDDVIDVKPITESLAERGLTPADIDAVIFSHLDWDHCTSIDPFVSSPFYVQRTEWEGTPSHPMFATSFAPAYHYERLASLDLRLLDGDIELHPGLKLVLAPGHTPGGQSAVVDTAAGRYVLAGMCVLHENFYPDDKVKEHFAVVPPGGHTDLFQAYDSMIALKEIAGDNVIPIHSLEAWELGKIG